MPTSCSHYFGETIRGAQRIGIDGELLLANVGLTREQVFDPQWRGNVELLARLVQLVWFATKDEFMGLVGRPAKLGTFAMMAHCIIAEPSLDAAIRKGVLFYDLFTDDLKMSLDVKEDAAIFTVNFEHPELDPEHYFLEFWLMIWYRMISWMGGGLPPLLRATFAYPRPGKYVEELKHVFRCGYLFDAPTTSLWFDARFLQQPVVRSRDELKRFLSVAPLGFMMMPEDEASLSRRVRSMLLAGGTLPLNFPTFEEVATAMRTNEQTLRRRLKQELTSYRTIKEYIRRDLAIQKLMESRQPVQEIAYLLGYSEPRAFTRAFQQWTGSSPIQYRTRLHQQFRP